MKDMVFKPLPVTMVELRHLKSEASHDISEEMVRKAVVCMRTRAAKLVAMDGREPRVRFRAHSHSGDIRDTFK